MTTINEPTADAFLADSILASPYFNDDADPMLTFDDLARYADYFRDDYPNLRDSLLMMLDLDLRDLAHNANYDDFIDDTRELSDDDFDDILRILHDPDTDLYDRIADALLARAFDFS